MTELRNRCLAAFSLGTLCLVLVGCASPESRIRKNPDLFASFPPAAQEKIRQGQVELGFTPAMAEMALGEPDRTYARQTLEGSADVWSYTAREVRPHRQQVTGRFSVRIPGEGYRTVSDTIWVDVDQIREFERLRLEFEDGVLSAVEEVTR